MSSPEQAVQRKPPTLHRLREMHAAGERITMLTCYDASCARLLDDPSFPDAQLHSY